MENTNKDIFASMFEAMRQIEMERHICDANNAHGVKNMITEETVIRIKALKHRVKFKNFKQTWMKKYVPVCVNMRIIAKKRPHLFRGSLDYELLKS